MFPCVQVSVTAKYPTGRETLFLADGSRPLVQGGLSDRIKEAAISVVETSIEVPKRVFVRGADVGGGPVRVESAIHKGRKIGNMLLPG